MIFCILISYNSFFVGCDYVSDKSKLTGDDYRLFYNTPVWHLAKAVRSENLSEIKRICKEANIDVNYQESIYGQTLLILTIKNHHYNSCKTLLELGADPNRQNSYDGTSAMVEAAGIFNHNGDNTQFLKLLLSHGGNPNDEEKGVRREGNSTRWTPLLKACCDIKQFRAYVSPINKVKLLVETGADVNHKNEFGFFPLKEAFIFENYDVVLYLLEKGANYNEVLFDRSIYGKGGKKAYIADELRSKLLPLDSEEYKQKMAIVDFLKEKGIDYRKVPIPDYITKSVKEEYPSNWKEYLDKY